MFRGNSNIDITVKFIIRNKPKTQKQSSLVTIPTESSWDTWAVSRIPNPPNPCWKILRFSNKKGKNHLIINTESGRKGELASCPNTLVRDCRINRLKLLGNL